jgi:hypothetical protein
MCSVGILGKYYHLGELEARSDGIQFQFHDGPH